MLHSLWSFVFRPRTCSRKRPAHCQLQVEPLEEIMLLSGITLLPAYLLAGHPLAAPQVGGGPAGLSPAQVRHAYGFDQVTFQNGSVAGNGSGETIAIVDANDDPNIANDLSVFDSRVRPRAAPPNFTKIGLDASGNASTTKMPAANQSWAGEISLDVEWAHAMAPGARILLVEANSASDTDLMRAVDYARNQSGVVAVSMSWGPGESSGEQSYDSYFTTPFRPCRSDLLGVIGRQRFSGGSGRPCPRMSWRWEAQP